jgi:peptidoglycan-associated lipoprotein
MMRTSRIAVMTIATLSVAVLSACRKSPPPAVAPAPVARSSDSADAARRAAEQERLRREEADRLARARADSIARADEALRNAASAAAGLRSTLTATVHFDYDQSDLRPDDKAVLDAKIPILQANTGVTIRISGHTDERGSDEYNLALGQRRAAAAKAYLVQHGIADARIETISYGEERPVAQGSDEGAYSQNRRAEFEITAGGNALKKP